MTEQQNPQPDPPKPEEKPVRAIKAVDESKRFAAYDTTLLRFVGKVCDTRTAARKEATDRKIDNYEIREV